MNAISKSEVIRNLKNITSSICLVAIDGRSGAGKSTFADEIASQIEKTSVVRMDDFYRVMDNEKRWNLNPEQGYQLYMDWQRVRRDVLVPLRRGHPARYQQYDWDKNHLSNWVEVVPQGLILVEGVYSTRPGLKEFFDWTIFVDTEENIRMTRQMDRGHNSMDWIERWNAAERFFEENFSPMVMVDFVVRGDS